MTMPSSFPSHWRAAVQHRDLSGFAEREDLIAFFDATSNYEGFMALTEEQRANVVELRSEPSGACLEATMRRHQKLAQEERLDNARRTQPSPRNESRRTEEKEPAVPAALAGPAIAEPPSAGTASADKANSWDKVIERVNKRFGLEAGKGAI
ncbi:hypothetical protein M2281_005776 [Mesorhizobium soli]|uniref:hypothetical protein n=1 Tax=Pseudaminobacter soli (ex Li et al. 2025) TaxID=1295366 RepID=UPI002474CD7B|nr:hypothetical protein [Mesorhizobium soli]MDH6235154.1 hypothetical protein [Mesorhizobium soli]